MLSHFTTSPSVVRRRRAGGWAASRGPCSVGCPSRIRTSVHGSKVRCPTTRRRGSGPAGRPADCRAGKWSGRRDSNPRPSPWQGDALPTEPLPLDAATTRWWCREPESNWRHRDFQSRALPTELSRPDGQPGFGRPSAVQRIARGRRTPQDDRAAGGGSGGRTPRAGSAHPAANARRGVRQHAKRIGPVAPSGPDPTGPRLVVLDIAASAISSTSVGTRAEGMPSSRVAE